MPKNKGKGGKNYRKAKNRSAVKRQLELKEQGTQYGIAEKMLGNARVIVKCFDEVARVGHIRGKMKKKVWIGVGDLVLCSLREFENKKCDIILKYTPDEIRQLKAQNLIPELTEGNKDSSDGIEFTDQLENLSQSSSEDQSSENESDEQIDLGKKIQQQRKGQVDIDNI